MSNRKPTPSPSADREAHANAMARIAQAQDKDAFAELFSYFAPRLKAYLLRLGAGDARAEELAQEVMVTVWRKAGTYDRRQASVSTWIFRIARNRRIDALRRENKGELDPHDPMLWPTEEPTPHDVVAAQQREAQVRAAMADLPDQQVELLRLAFFDGLSHSEIAKRQDLPLGTVKSRLRLTFQKLRMTLEREDT